MAIFGLCYLHSVSGISRIKKGTCSGYFLSGVRKFGKVFCALTDPLCCACFTTVLCYQH